MPAIDVTESDVEDLFYQNGPRNKQAFGSIIIDELHDNLWEILADFFSELVLYELLLTCTCILHKKILID